MQPARVLHVVGSLEQGGGIETWLAAVLRQNAPWRSELCCLDRDIGSLAEELEDSGLRVHRCRMTRNYLPFVLRFRRLLEDSAPDVVHTHMQQFGAPAIKAAALAGVPVRVAHYHNVKDGHRNDWSRRVYVGGLARWNRKYATRLVGCSRAALHAYVGSAWAEDPRCRVLHYGIDTSRFVRARSNGAMRQSLDIPGGMKIVGHVGRFAPQKNHEGLIEIARRVLCARSDVVFLLVGDGPLRADILERIRDAGLNAHFRHLPFTSDVPGILAAMDVFLFPSCWEGLGLAVVEALAAGLPVVASRLEAIEEAVEGTPTRCFTPGDYDAAARHVLDLLAVDAPDKAAFAPSSPFLSRFDMNTCVGALREIYES